MKRKNLILDETLLEEARRVSGEQTYSATVNQALDEMVRKHKVNSLIERLAEGSFFRPGYAEELYGEEWVREARKKLEKKGLIKKAKRPVAAMRVTAPKKRRGSRR